MQFSHPLMHNNFTKADMNAAIKLFKQKNIILTQSKYVKKFEKKWSKWLGVKYSVFVNSGSSANLLTMTVLKILYGKGEIILPPLTWVSDINSVIQNNFKPVFVDINPKNLCMSEEEIVKKVNKNTLAVFMTHAQGFNGLTSKLISFLKKRKVLLIEDVSESHGATFNKRKLGTFGKISNFSFYYENYGGFKNWGIVTDKYGFRKGNNKLSKRNNIVLIGDSVLFGWGVNSENSVPRKLHDITINNEIDIGIINAAVPSYSLDQSLHRYIHEIYNKKIPHDLIILQICIAENPSKIHACYHQLSLNLRDSWN